MRILFLCNAWHVTNTPCRTIGRHAELAGRPHQWVRAAASGHSAPGDLLFDLQQDTLHDIVRRMPDGEPDVMIVWEPGYQSLPRGIEEAPFPVVACYSDWNMVMPEQAGMLGLFDHLFTDRAGVRILGRMGYENVEFWPMWGHDPDFSRVIPGVEPAWDIGMIGNLNPQVQRERAPWLARVARLADRYRVRIAGGVYGEEYSRLMNATKITFNRSIRGEMNMRCYEAAACGSLLFYEEENEEIREFFEDRVHCVLYNARNLEELLDYYLTHEDERRRIVAAARERVADISFPRNLNRLAARLEELGLGSRRQKAEGRRQKTEDSKQKAEADGSVSTSDSAYCLLPTAYCLPPSAFRSLSLPELRKRQARQAAAKITPGSNLVAVGYVEEALELDPADDAAHNDLAVLLFLVMAQTQDDGEKRRLLGRCLDHMQRAVRLRRRSAFYQLNQAHMCAHAGRWEVALDLAQQALALLDSDDDDPGDPLCLAYPPGWTEYRVQFSGLFNATQEVPEGFPLMRRCLLLHRGGMLLGEIGEEQGLLPQAVLGFRVAAAARPDLGSGRAALARVLAAQGQDEEALVQIQAALKTDPFLAGAVELQIELLLRTNRFDQARQAAAEHQCIARALAPRPGSEAPLDPMADLEQAREWLARLLEQRTAAA